MKEDNNTRTLALSLAAMERQLRRLTELTRELRDEIRALRRSAGGEK